MRNCATRQAFAAGGDVAGHLKIIALAAQAQAVAADQSIAARAGQRQARNIQRQLIAAAARLDPIARSDPGSARRAAAAIGHQRADRQARAGVHRLSSAPSRAPVDRQTFTATSPSKL